LKENRVVYDIPITKEKDRFTRIDKETGQVRTEKKGIYCNGLKLGHSTTPGILFAEYREDPKELKKLANEMKKTRSQSGGERKEATERKAPFMPPSLKSGMFQTDKEMYGGGNENIKELIKGAIEVYS
jgi:hypothetical protein